MASCPFGKMLWVCFVLYTENGLMMTRFFGTQDQRVALGSWEQVQSIEEAHRNCPGHAWMDVSHINMGSSVNRKRITHEPRSNTDNTGSNTQGC